MSSLIVLQGASTVHTVQGTVFLIDQADWPIVGRVAWHCHPSSNKKKRYVFTRRRLCESQNLAVHFYIHRYLMGATKGQLVDHINGDPLDNRRSNLRTCTARENLRNQRSFGGRYSKYKGVCWDKSRGRWMACIRISGRRIYKRFDDEKAAARWYDSLAAEHFGRFAYTNAEHFGEL